MTAPAGASGPPRPDRDYIVITAPKDDRSAFKALRDTVRDAVDGLSKACRVRPPARHTMNARVPSVYAKSSNATLSRPGEPK